MRQIRCNDESTNFTLLSDGHKQLWLLLEELFSALSQIAYQTSLEGFYGHTLCLSTKNVQSLYKLNIEHAIFVNSESDTELDKIFCKSKLLRESAHVARLTSLAICGTFKSIFACM